MTDEQQLYDLIGDYLLDRLSDEEAGAFTLRVEQDPALKALVEQYRLALLGLQERREENIRNKISAWKENMDSLPAPPPGLAGEDGEPRPALGYKRFIWLKWAAVIIPLIVAGVWFAHFWNNKQQQQPAAANTKKDTSLTVPAAESPAFVQIPNVQSDSDKTGIQLGNNPGTQAPISEPAGKETESKSVSSPAQPDYSSFTDEEYAFLSTGPSKGNGRRNNPAQTAVRDTIGTAVDLIGAGKPGQALRLLNACRGCDSVDLAKWRAYAYYRQRRFDLAAAENKYWYDKGFFKEDAQWYLLLSCIANGKKPEKTFLEAYQAISADTLHKYHGHLRAMEQKMQKQRLFLKK